MHDPPRPLTQAVALDPHYYVDAAIYEFEQSQILSRGWQIIGPASELSGVGDIIVRRVGGHPICVVRSAAGNLNGFYNICPHRAGPIATCDAKGLKRLRCGYHGWSYDLEGSLKSAPEMKNAEGFDLETVKLSPVDVREWRGLIWVNLNPEQPLEACLSGIDDIVGGGLNGLAFHSRRTYDVTANWKVYVDNYLEGYHLPFVHPGLTQVVDYSTYRTELYEWWSLQRSPVTDDQGAYALGEALYFFIFPNTMLNIMPGRLQTNRVMPDGLGGCRVEFDFYYTPETVHRAAEDFAFSDEVQEEDRLICEHVQKGLTSGIYKPGRLSPARESGVWHWQNILRGYYAELSGIS